MFPANENNEPFKGPLENIDDSHMKIKKIPDNPNRLIRPEWLKRDLNTEGVVREIKQRQALFNELKDKYNINLPRFDYVAGHGPAGGKMAYLVVEKIDGKNLSRIDKFKPEEADKLKETMDNMCASLAQYLIDKLESGEDFLDDIHRQDQFLVSEKEGDIKAVMVDLESFHTYKRGQGDREQMRYLSFGFTELTDTILSLEKKLGYIKLKKARQTINELAGLLMSKFDILKDSWLRNRFKQALAKLKISF